MLIVVAVVADAVAVIVVVSWYFCYCQSHSLNRRSVDPSVSCFCTRSTFALSECFCYAFWWLSYIRLKMNFGIERIHSKHRTNDISCVYFHNFTCVIQKERKKIKDAQKKYPIRFFLLLFNSVKASMLYKETTVKIHFIVKNFNVNTFHMQRVSKFSDDNF